MSGFRGGRGHLKGFKASSVMIQGEILVPKDFPFKGPKGIISSPWMSRATLHQPPSSLLREIQRLTTPIIHQNQAKDMVIRIIYPYRLPQIARLSNHSRNFQLIIKPPCRPENHIAFKISILPSWSHNRRIRYYDCGAAAMITNGEVLESRWKLPLLEHRLAGIKSVIARTGEVSKVYDGQW